MLSLYVAPTTASWTISDSIQFLNGKQISSGQLHKLRSGFRIILGEHHVFRFNNPEEVRKQRDRATLRSNLQFSLTAADLESRPDSPTSSSGELGDVDWTFAKREAALARLGLDPALDSLPDEDLNKLYERITLVKNIRDHNSKHRPESSLSQADDLWSESGRPFSSDALTDDTSVDAGPSRGSPDVDALKEVQNQLDVQRQEFESRLRVISESTEAEDLKEEKDHMQHQLKLVQMQMRRLLDARARGETELEAEAFEPIMYSAKQLRLIRKVLDKWRAHRSFSMAETVLSAAVIMKEANVISKELVKDVSYNFTVASGGPLAAPMSSINTIAGLDEFGDVADPVLASATQPTVAVKVLDRRHNAIYVWSLDRLRHQIQRMRNLTSFIDRPSYSQHFSSEEPFYNSPPPEYSFVGNALLSLAPLSRRLSSTSVVPIFCRYTAEAIGSCRVDIKIVNVVMAPKYNPSSTSSTRSSSPVPGTLPSGSKLSFFLTVDSVKGLAPHDFSAAHLQVRLSSFVGPSLKAEEIYHSNSVDLDSAAPSDLKFRRSFSVVVNSRVLTYLRQGYAPIELFASTRPQYLERIERWDEMREQKSCPPVRSPPPDSESGTSQPMRRSETDFFMEQSHDVVAWLQVRELGPDGQYIPVPVVSQGNLDPGAFSLHQGLQRRLVLTMTSNSGRQLPWTEVVKTRVGNVRLLDTKGRVHESSSRPLATLPLQQNQVVEFKPDGSGFLSAESLWDSSIHNSLLLNRVTPTNQRVLLQVSWSVAVESCADPVHFSTDMAVTMQTRDARPPSRLLTLLSSTRILSKTSNVFTVRLSPPLTRSPKDLWRLDTSEKYVRGEEVLRSWRPRGITVVEDHTKLVTMEHRAADVQAVRAILANSTVAAQPSQADATVWGSDQLVHKSLELWKKQFGHRGEIVLSQEPTELEDAAKPSTRRQNLVDASESRQLVSSTKLVPRSDVPTKKGHLMILVDANQDIWERRWFVLRRYCRVPLSSLVSGVHALPRPYLHVYKQSNEVEEITVISLDGVNVESNSDMESLLGKRFTFTLFTSSNSHALAAPSPKELQAWTTKLDPTRLPP
jgi:kinesin family protein 1